jgi:two-component system response regulator AlgR
VSTSNSERRLLIVDDEEPARERLERIVGEIAGWVCAGVCASGAEALEAIVAGRPDVVLLDIEMPGVSGIELARRLADLESPPAVVFTTAYDQFALEAFDSRAAGYVLKPVRRERLVAALDHAARLADALVMPGADAGGSREQLAIRVRDEVRLVHIVDVRYFQSDNKYTTVYHAHGEDLIEESLKQLEREFAGRFVRIHRSALVAVAQIERLERLDDGAYQVRLREAGTCLPVSRRQIAELKARLAAGR